ncbi:2Fe-2S iron-sulfur cluster binding domain-containing protein [Planctomycetales bacterium ZRK34]|nr:2Fe-2S iron-sulfur cluster binding domain-containing protein [Planctomycetales bacterium ZRK34]
MPTIKIGDKVCEFEGRKTVLQVAQENGIEIPSYCYHPGLSIVASCRICLAEVAQPNPKTGELQTIPKLVPTCQHPAVDGSEVYIQSEKTRANQKAVMEYLLINHPLDCPVCDQAGECYLQDYSYRYGRASSRFEENKIKQPKKDVGDNVLLYSDRCIMCTRCVRFTREVTGTAELSVQGRGCKEEIDIFPGRPLNNELSGNVVDICPVGALLDKQFLFEQRVWYLKSAASIDPITASGDNIWIDHNKDRIWRVKPRTNEDVNKWWISDEIRYGWKFALDEGRLTMPRRKVQGALEDTDWKQAYQAAIEGLKAKKLAVMVSPMLSCEDAYMLGKAVRAIDEGALLAVGPVPRHGEDKTFPGGYTIYAEKAPNARGVKRVLEQIAGEGNVVDFDAFIDKVSERDAVVLTGNYPSEWVTQKLADAIKGKFTVLIDTLPNRLTDAVDVLLPSVTWAEKSGTFENVNNRLQAFEAAIPPIEFAHAEAQIGLDLLAAAGIEKPARYDAATVRAEIGGALADEVHLPSGSRDREPDMQYVEL